MRCAWGNGMGWVFEGAPTFLYLSVSLWLLVKSKCKEIITMPYFWGLWQGVALTTPAHHRVGKKGLQAGNYVNFPYL